MPNLTPGDEFQVLLWFLSVPTCVLFFSAPCRLASFSHWWISISGMVNPWAWVPLKFLQSIIPLAVWIHQYWTWDQSYAVWNGWVMSYDSGVSFSELFDAFFFFAVFIICNIVWKRSFGITHLIVGAFNFTLVFFLSYAHETPVQLILWYCPKCPLLLQMGKTCLSLFLLNHWVCGFTISLKNRFGCVTVLHVCQ